MNHSEMMPYQAGGRFIANEELVESVEAWRQRKELCEDVDFLESKGGSIAISSKECNGSLGDFKPIRNMEFEATQYLIESLNTGLTRSLEILQRVNFYLM